MRFFEKPQKLPIGEKEFLEKRKETTLPSFEVANKVMWRNPAFEEAPFKIKEGEPTPLGRFLIPDKEIPLPQDEHVKELSIAPEKRSGRSAAIEPIIFRDRDGNLYRDVDLKGVGGFLTNFYPKFEYRPTPVRPLEDNPNDRYGILNLSNALYDRDFSEAFHKENIRTYRVITITELGEILDNEGKRVSIQEAKERGILPPTTIPVVEVRAFATRERISWLHNEDERARLALKDAKTLVAQELERNPESFSDEEYFLWFSKTLGEQIARIKKQELYHGFLHSQNITLDCRIVDLDSVRPIEMVLKGKKDENITPESLHAIDYHDALHGSLGELLMYNSRMDLRDVCYDAFEKSYEEELKKKTIKGIIQRLFRKWKKK